MFRIDAMPAQFKWHTGRVYMFAAVPTGSLRAAQAPAPTGDATESFAATEYVDEADVTWYPASPLMSASQQPDWAACVPADDQPADCPFKKFTAPTGNGGSYEAVLMPDGASVDAGPECTQAPCAYTYSTWNWLTTSPLVGTWNYSDPSSFGGSYAHIAWDVLPHDESVPYVELPAERWRQSADFVDFLGYPNHLREEMLRLAAGDDIARTVDGTVYHVTNAEEGQSPIIMALLASVDEPVQSDTAALVWEAAGALGQVRYGLAPPGSSTDDTLRAALGPGLIGECTGAELSAEQLCWTNMFFVGHGLIDWDIVHPDGSVESASTGPMLEGDLASDQIWEVAEIRGPKAAVAEPTEEPVPPVDPPPADDEDYCSYLTEGELDVMFHGGPLDQQLCENFLRGDGFEEY